jgi:hypothetical protein
MPWIWGSIEPDQSADVAHRGTIGAKFTQPGGSRRFRKLVAAGIEDKAVVVITRLRQAE